MILEGAMIIIGVTAITIMHPYFGFSGAWNEAGWNLRKSKTVEEGGYDRKSQSSGQEMM